MATKITDNFATIREMLKFDTPGDFYLILILKRAKDLAEKIPAGTDDDSRLIRHYCIYDLGYFDRKLPTIMQLCRDNKARAYILPQRRNSKTVLWDLHDKVSDMLRSGNCGMRMDRLLRSCIAGCHQSDRKRWVIDIDRGEGDFVGMNDMEFGTAVFAVVGAVDRLLADSSGSPTNITLLPTPHGCHIVCPPFPRDLLVRSSIPVGGRWVRISEDRIKPDAMTVLYAVTEN